MFGEATVAIVGGGCSGTLAAIHLLADPDGRAGPLRIVLIDRTPDLGRGVAYRTTCDRHVLNVPAGDMSAFPDDSTHFVRWLRQHQPGQDAGSFVRRQIYGVYLESVLRQMRHDAGADRSLEVVRAHVVDIAARPDHGLVLACSDGRQFEARDIVLAVGNFPPHQPSSVEDSAVASGRYIRDPWADDIVERIHADASIVLLGSGLTAVDAALALSSHGHRGPIHAVSRHGLLPRAHHLCRLAPIPDGGVASGYVSARSLLRAVRDQVMVNDEAGGDWRSVIDGLRTTSNEIWAQLPVAEQRRLLCHVGPYWNTYRHRMAPQVATWIEELAGRGQFTVSAGRLERCTVPTGGRPRPLRIRIRPRGTADTVSIDADYLINCTGPASDVAALGDPLLDALLARGMARPGPLGIGLAVSANGAVLDQAGSCGGRLWAIGSLRQGTEWETTAVPELRRQAAAVAARLATHRRAATARRASDEHDVDAYPKAV